MSPEGVPGLVDHQFRHETARLVSRLVAVLGPVHLDLAEEVVQEALIAALQTWPYRGVPDNPAAWLMQVARHRAIDAIRHHRFIDADESALERALARIDSGGNGHWSIRRSTISIVRRHRLGAYLRSLRRALSAHAHPDRCAQPGDCDRRTPRT